MSIGAKMIKSYEGEKDFNWIFATKSTSKLFNQAGIIDKIKSVKGCFWGFC